MRHIALTCRAVLLGQVLVLYQAAEQALAGGGRAVRDNVLQAVNHNKYVLRLVIDYSRLASEPANRHGTGACQQE
jgi:hypothetical protein